MKRVVLHSEKRRIRIRIRISLQRREEGQLESVLASIFSNAAELVFQFFVFPVLEHRPFPLDFQTIRLIRRKEEYNGSKLQVMQRDMQSVSQFLSINSQLLKSLVAV